MLSASPRDSPGAVAAAIQSKTGAAGGVGGIGSRSNNNKQQTTATAAPGVSKDVLLGQQTALKVRERKFENGDRYRGGWLNGLVSLRVCVWRQRRGCVEATSAYPCSQIESSARTCAGRLLFAACGTHKQSHSKQLVGCVVGHAGV